MAQYTVGRTWKDAELRISFAKLRTDPIQMAHLTVANLEAIGAGCEEFLFMDRKAPREAAIMTLVGDFPPDIALLEGRGAGADGLIGAMGTNNPRAWGRLYAASDALALDLVAARHLGSDPRDSGILRAACHWFGDPSARVDVIGPSEALAGWRHPRYSDWTALLAFFAYPVFVLASGRGAIFAPAMDEAAFPPRGKVGPALRLARRAMRALLGLRQPG